MSPRRGRVPFWVRYHPHVLSELPHVIATIASGFLIRDLNLHPDFCKAGLWKCLLLKVQYKLNWLELINHDPLPYTFVSLSHYQICICNCVVPDSIITIRKSSELHNAWDRGHRSFAHFWAVFLAKMTPQVMTWSSLCSIHLCLKSQG